ncbi:MULTISPECIES: TrmB family transcriptional regulator [Brevibacillus]|uniref:TrmB family transcriptional regulator n=1 Tax=Brevibacillus TaxID=55080 RepID=UPI000EE0B0EB|nr:helix-turn-helix domain-containing protein [Brevibacillus sp.]HBZ79395.1 TrmB family transcriptional regulator [Brevibacillus sp.]
MELLLDKFEEIGFSKNEAKVYVTLLKEPLQNGYEISKKSGVPRSMVYAVIAKLVSKQAVIELRTEPPTYRPVPIKELMANLKKQHVETIDYLEQELQAMEKPVEVHVIRHMEERAKILSAMQSLLTQAKEEVWLSAWDEELDELKGAAEAAQAQGIRLFSLLFADQKTASFGNAFYHEETSAIEKRRMGQRLTIVIQDDQQVLIASFLDGRVPQAIQTTDPMLILLAKEYIRHDMTLKAVSAKWGVGNLADFCQSDERLAYIVHSARK